MKNNLDNFESFIKNSLDGHEAPFSDSSWSKIQEGMNKNASTSGGFESFVKKSLDAHEAPYSPSAWTAIAAILRKAATPFYKTKGFIAAASVLLIAGVVFLALPENDEPTKNIAKNNASVISDNNVESNIVANNNTIENNNAKGSILVNEERIIENNSTANENDNTNNTILVNNKTPESHSASDNVVISDSDTPSTNNNNDGNMNSSSNDNDDAKTRTDFEKIYSATFDASKNICQGQKMNLTPKLIDEDLTYEWLVNGESISNKTNYSVIINKTGINTVDLIATNTKGEKVARHTKIITVGEIPKNDILHTQTPYSLINKHSFEINDNVKAITWNFGDGETSTELNAKHTYKQQGKYNLSYLVENESGCTATFNRSIIAKGYYNIRTNHGFSPDGDGSLDFFLPEELKQINQPFEMAIYSRLNVEMFKTTDINNPWNGRNKEGSMAPFGVYVWVVNLTNELGNKEIYKGTVTKASN